MAGTVADRELAHGTRMRFAVATVDDDAAIRRLLRVNPMQGTIRLAFTREPDYFRSAGLAGAEDTTIVAYSRGKLVCMGHCSRRECWIDGRIASVGYLAELRLDSAVRGQFAFVRAGYRFFRELERSSPADFYFTSIAVDNHRARRFLEKGVRGMPSYGFLGELATVVVKVPRRPRVSALKLEIATPGCLPDIVRFLNTSARRRQLATVWNEENLLALSRHGLPLTHFLVARDRSGIAACGALWDQREFRQTVIHGYAAPLTLIRPLLNIAALLFGTPHLPRAGSILGHAFLSPLAFAEGADALLPDFIEACFASARELGVDYVTLALPEGDPRLDQVRRRFATRVYRSRLYRVAWPGDGTPEVPSEEACFLPDVSLL